MVKTIFADAIVRNLCTYFERKVTPTPQAIDMWFDRVKKIPDEPVDWIVSRVKELQESFPKNLPNMLWELYREWLASRPEKQEHRHVDCDKCNGDGYVFALRFDDSGRHYEYGFRCPACDQSRDNGIPYWSMTMISDGYRPLEDQKKPVTRQTIREMLAGIGKPMHEAVT